MPAFFRPSSTWVVDFRYEGHPRRWYKVFGQGADVHGQVTAQLLDLYGKRAQLIEARPATSEEETLYLRGEAPTNRLCPTGRHDCTDVPASPPPQRPT